jgi:hypothetical protein
VEVLGDAIIQRGSMIGGLETKGEAASSGLWSALLAARRNPGSGCDIGEWAVLNHRID